MASVSVVSVTDFRTSLSPQPNTAAEGDEPFSLLLNAIADGKAGMQRPEAPKVAERADLPAKSSKPETDAERQARRRAPDAETAETKPRQEPAAAAKPASAKDDGEETESDADGEHADAADALLMIAQHESQQAAVSTAVDAADAQAAPVAQAAVQAQTAPADAAAIMAASVAQAETQPVQTTQNAATAKAQFETAPASAQADAEVEIALPKISAETVSSLLKPQKTASPLEAQMQTQPGPASIAPAPTLQAPTHLEMLSAAINKHAVLSLGTDAGEPKPDAPKPLLSSNAVAPNFAMTTQASAPVTAQTQQVADAARAVPLEQLAVEIATRASKGERRFDIRLDPPELGRIDVRLEIDHKGNTTTKLIVERAETLDLLQRDARGLEKALQSAGLKTDAGGLEFSLRQDAQTQQGQQSGMPDFRDRSAPAPAESEAMTEVSIHNASIAAQLRGGVDIRI